MVRCQGLLDSPRQIGADGHACWTFEDPAGDSVDAAVAFLVEGRELGQALVFVGGPETEKVVRSVEPLASMVADGSLEIVPFEALYPDGRRLPDAEQWAAYEAAVERARDAGFTGLRVLAEVTALASPEGSWRAHAGWESYADRRMPEHRMAALCCFERDVLPDAALAAIASAHPVVDRRLRDLAPFRLFARADAVVIAGEVDAFSSGTLRQLLSADEGEVGDRVLDLDELAFVDHTALLALQEYADRVRAQGGTVIFRGGPPTLRRLAQLLGVSL